MVAVTYGVARVPAEKAEAAPRKRWYRHLLDAMIAARMRQARREIALHAHLLPYSLDERGNRLVKRGADEMPFGGW